MDSLNSGFYLIASGATEGSRYVDCLDKQKQFFKGFNYHAFVVPCRGSWEENTKIKPSIIRKAFAFCPNVLWIDSDCTIDAPNDLPEGDFDIGIIDNIHPKHRCRISAGFIFFRDTPETHAFLKEWEVQMKKKSKDHPALIDTIKKMKHKMKIKNISYWLKDRHEINTFTKNRGQYAG